MAGESKQIYQLTTKEFDGNVLVPFDTPNTDPSTQAQKPYISGKASGDAVADFIANTEEYATDLDTTAKTITGAINELHAINGYNYDAYDDTATYAVGDLCIYNNTLYKCTTAITTAEAWNVSHWAQTSIAGEISELKSGKADISDIPTKTSDLSNDSGFPVVTNVSWGQSMSINYIKSNFLLFVGDRVFSLWFSGSGYANPSIRNLGSNQSSSGSGSTSIDDVTVTRTSSGFTVTTTANATLTVIG